MLVCKIQEDMKCSTVHRSLTMATVQVDKNRVLWQKHTMFGRACILLSCTLIGWVLYSWILICYTIWCGTLVFFAPLFLFLGLFYIFYHCFCGVSSPLLPFTSPLLVRSPFLPLLVPPFFLNQILSRLLFIPTSSFYPSSSCFWGKGYVVVMVEKQVPLAYWRTAFNYRNSGRNITKTE